MSKTLIIAEQPSVAIDLARVLGVKKSGDHYENDRYVISSAVGHVVEMVPPEGAEVKRGKWKLENLPVLPDHFDLVPKEKTKDRLYLLKKLAQRPDVTDRKSTRLNSSHLGISNAVFCLKKKIKNHRSTVV